MKDKGRFSLLTILILLFLFMFLFSILDRFEKKAIRVVILNASGKDELDKLYKDYLKENGMDVLYTEDVMEEDIKSVIVDRYSKKCKYAKRIAKILKINNYVPIVDTNFQEEVIVILGKDADKTKIFKKGERIEKNNKKKY
uniref:LytR family transcriptional regulator n=1 Tax=candidate division WOR-3 bacterium TaxID=2052148 RepID=A0A7C4U7V7_UNCW3